MLRLPVCTAELLGRLEPAATLEAEPELSARAPELLTRVEPEVVTTVAGDGASLPGLDGSLAPDEAPEVVPRIRELRLLRMPPVPDGKATG
jgi:hypothetical protein